jgi:hypothetical protein
MYVELLPPSPNLGTLSIHGMTRINAVTKAKSSNPIMPTKTTAWACTCKAIEEDIPAQPQFLSSLY